MILKKMKLHIPLYVLSVLVCLCLMLASCMDKNRDKSEKQTEESDTLTSVTETLVTEDETEDPSSGESAESQSSENPSGEPTENITDEPTDIPTEKPTEYPSETDSEQPVDTSSENITDEPTEEPTEDSSEIPTEPSHTVHEYDSPCDRDCNICHEIRENIEHTQGISPTCENQAVCSVCNEKYGNPLGHDFSDATCLLPEICKRCNETRGEAKGHKKYIKIPAKSPTCTTDGYTERVECRECNAIIKYPQVSPATGHTPAKIMGYSPTCTLTGVTDGEFCIDCQVTLKEQIDIPANGHTQGVSATCVSRAICSVCNSFYGELDLQNHNWNTNYDNGNNEGHFKECLNTGCTQQKDFGTHTFEGGICTVCKFGCEHSGGETTCTEKAVCVQCGMSYGSPAGHVWGEYISDNNATCQKFGTETSICSNCSQKDTKIIPDIYGDHEIEITPKVEPTCTNVGYTQEEKCKICSQVITGGEIIQKLEHTVKILFEIPPTCTEDGLGEGQECSLCLTVLVERNVISATGHDYTAADCENPEQCKNCADVRSPALGHEYSSVACNETGICSRCGKANDSPSGHVEYAVGSSKEPTCTSQGYTQAIICSRCGIMLQERKPLPATGHEPEKLPDKTVTCTEDGYTDRYACKKCGEVTDKGNVTEKTGHIPKEPLMCGEVPICNVCNEPYGSAAVHNWGEYISNNNATCQTYGTETSTCLVCGVTKNRVVEEYGDHVEETIRKVFPTCTETGLSAGKKCSVCGEILVEQTLLPAFGHEWLDYTYNATHHQRNCFYCNEVTENEPHTLVDYRCYCGYKDRKFYTLNNYPGGYHRAFDYIKIDSSIVASSTSSPSTYSYSSSTIQQGQTVTLQGWLGLPQGKISTFGYYFNDEVGSAYMSTSFMTAADAGVIAAGGEYRFAVNADTMGLTEAKNTLTFIAVTENNEYITIKTINLTVTGTDGEKPDIPDSEMVKAEKEEIGDVNMIITSTGNSGEYKTPTGITFTASGTNLGFSGGRLTFNSNLKLNISDYTSQFAESFNKYKIAYYSSVPLKLIVTYTQNSTLITDTVYLEAGDDMLFNCLIPGYLSGYNAKHIRSLDIQVLGDTKNATFALYDIETQNVEVIGSHQTTYISNSRYRLGINLSWGGGISYLRDKQNAIPGVANLINCADTGRLVQQSYYGTLNASEYQPGTYNGTTWHYNPVQGGNLGNNASRLIDFTIEDFSIYIKAQPQDWAKYNLAPAYMENVYTLYSDRVQVDNRFTDYAGFKTNPVRDQELPAFYTIGYLNTFKYYDGTSPWQGGALTTLGSLPFWGGNASSYYSLTKGNSETWCAWVNGDTDYGLGLYTPNIDTFLAGRHQYDASPDQKSDSSAACSYVAPLNKLKIVSYKSLEYSYLITSGSTEQIRALFKTYKNFATNADLTSSEFGYRSVRK